MNIKRLEQLLELAVLHKRIKQHGLQQLTVVALTTASRALATLAHRVITAHLLLATVETELLHTAR